MLSSLRIQVNQTFSHFFFVRESCAANNASIVQKVNKKKRRSMGSLNRCAIQYEVSVCASHLPKHSHLVSATVDETILLLTALVGA